MRFLITKKISSVWLRSHYLFEFPNFFKCAKNRQTEIINVIDNFDINLWKVSLSLPVRKFSFFIFQIFSNNRKNITRWPKCHKQQIQHLHRFFSKSKITENYIQLFNFCVGIYRWKDTSVFRRDQVFFLRNANVGNHIFLRYINSLCRLLCCRLSRRKSIYRLYHKWSISMKQNRFFKVDFHFIS